MRGISYFVVLALFLSCTSKNAVPKDILPPKKMQVIVWDMMQADELAFQNRLTDSTLNLKSESFHLYDEIFAIHKTTRQQYYRSYKYYQEHPDLYKSLMEDVKKIAEKQKDTVRKASVKLSK